MFSLQTWRRVFSFFSRTPLATALVVFVLAFILATTLQLNNSFADPDSFYHAGMAALIRDHVDVRQFTWLPYTSLADTFVDQHFLYHVFLVPFVTFANPLVGIKIAAVLLVAIMASVFFAVLRVFRVRGAFVFTLLLLAVNPFMFRMNLAKTPSLAVAMLFIGLWLLFSFRNRWLFWFAWFYVWVYGGFSILAVAAGCFALAGEVGLWFRRRRVRSGPGPWLNTLTGRSQLPKAGYYARGLVAVILGIVAGLVLNPSFPTNVRFYEDQLVKIGIINYQHTIGVGGEWYPYAIGDLLPGTVFVSIAVLLGLLAVAFEFRRQTVRSWALLLMTAFLMFMTLKSRRYVEYYVPVAMAFSAFAITDALTGRTARELAHDVQRMLRRSIWAKLAGGALILYLGVGAVGVAIRDLRGVQRDLANGLPANSLAAASDWLKIHAPNDAIIAHSDWDEFPILFYHDPTHRYIAGLDATFFYERNPDLYWKWVRLTTGQAAADTVYPILHDDLKAKYVILTKDHTAMDALLARTANLRPVYDDAEAKIYQVLY